MTLLQEAMALRERIRERLRELAPLVREYEQLTSVAEEMGLDLKDVLANTSQPESPPKSTADEPPTPPGAASRQPVKSAGRRRAPAPTSATRRRDGATELNARIVEAVARDPGGTVSVYAERLGMQPAALYRPVRDLASKGELVKRGRQLLLP